MKQSRCRPIAHSWALWLLAAALLLRALMPLVASAAAEARGQLVVEVCTVYGMSMVRVDEASVDQASPLPGLGTPKPVDKTAHANHECPLLALAGLASVAAPPMAATAAGLPSRCLPLAAAPGRRGQDAATAWVAGRKQGPPTTA